MDPAAEVQLASFHFMFLYAFVIISLATISRYCGVLSTIVFSLCIACIILCLHLSIVIFNVLLLHSVHAMFPSRFFHRSLASGEHVRHVPV